MPNIRFSQTTNTNMMVMTLFVMNAVLTLTYL